MNGYAVFLFGMMSVMISAILFYLINKSDMCYDPTELDDSDGSLGDCEHCSGIGYWDGLKCAHCSGTGFTDRREKR